MSTIKILGQIVSAAEGALSIVGSNTQEESYPASPDLVALQVPDKSAFDQLSGLMGGLGPKGDKRTALAQLFPELPAKHLAATLAVANELTAALRNDGKVDPGEMMGLVMAAMREEL